MKNLKEKTRTSRDERAPGSRRVSIAKNRSYAFYGRSGTGKTTLAASFPGPLLLLDIRDEGTDSISDVKDLDMVQIEDFADLEEQYWWLVSHPKAYKTIIIDTVSQWQQMCVAEIAKKSGNKGKAAGDWGSMSQRAWGDVAGKMKEWIINFRDLTKLGMDVVFIAQDRVFNMGEDDADENSAQIAPEVGPALSPSIAKVLNAAVSMIGNTFLRERLIKKEVKGKKVTKAKIEYCLRVGPNSVYVTKVRKPRGIEAPALIVDPTYEDLIEIIKGE